MIGKKVFISYAAEDAAVAEVLGAWVNDVFSNRCQAFVSTGYESLPPGQEWFPGIKAAIQDSDLLYCLLGPRSRSRPWLYFESGAAWLKGIPVVPIVHSGLRKDDLGPPLGQLQALELSNPEFSTRFFQRIADTLKLGKVPSRMDWVRFASEINAALLKIRGPREVVSLWNDALQKGDVTLAEQLTSTTAQTVIQKRWGSMHALSAKSFMQAGPAPPPMK